MEIRLSAEAVAAGGEHLVQLDGGTYIKKDGSWSRLEGASIDSLLRLSLDELRRLLEVKRPASSPRERAAIGAPIESQEVWAAGVTYRRSLEARADEAVNSDPYDRVYVAARPELFFKATASRVRGHLQPIFIRSDSTWDVPEPELALVNVPKVRACLQVFDGDAELACELAKRLDRRTAGAGLDSRDVGVGNTGRGQFALGQLSLEPKSAQAFAY